MHYSDTKTVSGVIGGRTIDLLGNGKPNVDMDLECIEIGIPSRRLKRFDLVDTPGNTPSPRFDPSILPTSDLLVWCTLATQAWKESERSYWMSLPMRHQRNGILVATHKDCLRNEGEANQVRSRLAAETATCFRAVVLVGKSSAGVETVKRQRSRRTRRADQRILAAISKRRIAAAYRIAGHVVRRALMLLKSEPARGCATDPLGPATGRIRRRSDSGQPWKSVVERRIPRLLGLVRGCGVGPRRRLSGRVSGYFPAKWTRFGAGNATKSRTIAGSSEPDRF